eukprot:PhM_4_TR2895/c0_g1_i1/m.101560
MPSTTQQTTSNSNNNIINTSAVHLQPPSTSTLQYNHISPETPSLANDASTKYTRPPSPELSEGVCSTECSTPLSARHPLYTVHSISDNDGRTISSKGIKCVASTSTASARLRKLISQATVFLIRGYCRYFEEIPAGTNVDDAGFVPASDVTKEITHLMMLSIMGVMMCVQRAMSPAMPNDDTRRYYFSLIVDLALCLYCAISVLVIVKMRKKPRVPMSRVAWYSSTVLWGAGYCLLMSYNLGTRTSRFEMLPLCCIIFALFFHTPPVVYHLMTIATGLYMTVRSIARSWESLRFKIYAWDRESPTFGELVYYEMYYVFIIFFFVWMVSLMRAEQRKAKETLRAVQSSTGLITLLKLDDAITEINATLCAADCHEVSTDRDTLYAIRRVAERVKPYLAFLPATFIMGLAVDDEDERSDDDDDDDEELLLDDTSVVESEEDSMTSSFSSTGDAMDRRRTRRSLQRQSVALITSGQSMAKLTGNDASSSASTITLQRGITIMALAIDFHVPDDGTPHDPSAFLAVLSEIVLSKHGLIHSYHSGVIFISWTKCRAVKNTCEWAASAALDLLHCVHDGRLAMGYLRAIRMGIDYGPVGTGKVGDPKVRMFTELRGTAVEGAEALCFLCDVLEAPILISTAAHTQLARSVRVLVDHKSLATSSSNNNGGNGLQRDSTLTNDDSPLAELNELMSRTFSDPPRGPRTAAGGTVPHQDSSEPPGTPQLFGRESSRLGSFFASPSAQMIVNADASGPRKNLSHSVMRFVGYTSSLDARRGVPALSRAGQPIYELVSMRDLQQQQQQQPEVPDISPTSPSGVYNHSSHDSAQQWRRAIQLYLSSTPMSCSALKSALDAFGELLVADPTDGPAAVYVDLLTISLNRCTKGLVPKSKTSSASASILSTERETTTNNSENETTIGPSVSTE